jgi:hypothetical protein
MRKVILLLLFTPFFIQAEVYIFINDGDYTNPANWDS